jgi:8-oxo-dGTP diphosphatase
MSYIPPIVTVDGVVFQLIHNALHVLLIKRQREPFEGKWALPGSYVSNEESVAQALRRTLRQKAGVAVDNCGVVEQLYTFDTAMRDPRGHAVTVAYMALCKDMLPQMSSSTEQPEFLKVDALPPLAFDHHDIIMHARARLRGKITYTNAVFALLPKHFTLSELQMAYESILGTQLDKRNFRKKFLSLQLIAATDEYRRDGAYRPARLYTFKQQQLQVLSRSFD